MRIAAICPTFRRPRLIPGIIQMFLNQTHPGKVLLILDDGNSFDSQGGGAVSQNPLDTFDGPYQCHVPDQPSSTLWRVISAAQRRPTVWHKFNELLDLAAHAGVDAVALMEDDDCYRPGYLEAHARALESAPWSASRRCWFREPEQMPRIVDATRRFHGGWAYRLDAVREVGGYPTEPYGSDTTLGERLRERFGEPADPWPEGSPEYLYRWQTSGYRNAHGYGETMHEAMAASHPPEQHTGRIVPGLDDRQSLHLAEIDYITRQQSAA